MTGYTINFLLLHPYLFLLQWFILPYTWPIPLQCRSPPSCSPAILCCNQQAFVGCSGRVWRMCERVCLCVKEGGIDFWWMVGVLFLLYMWKRPPGMQGYKVNTHLPGKTRKLKSVIRKGMTIDTMVPQIRILIFISFTYFTVIFLFVCHCLLISTYLVLFIQYSK